MLTKKHFMRLNRVTHRDLGYFCSAFIIAYCFSGIALNHIDEWNPDFIIEKRTIALPQNMATAQVPLEEITPEQVTHLGSLVGETDYRTYDVPAPGHLKIYFKDATLHARFFDRVAEYEKVKRRPIFYEANVLHRNGVKIWRWGSDLFASGLILVNLTGLFILRGKYGFGRRGWWLMTAGLLPPAIVLTFQG